MKIISEYPELVGRTFTSIIECAIEEEKVLQKRKEEKERLEKETQVAKTAELKSKLGAAVEDAGSNLAEAYTNHEKVKDEVRKILEESNDTMTKMLTESKEKVSAAERAYEEALAKYHKEFGTYIKVSTIGNSDSKSRNTMANKTFVDVLNDFLN